MYTEPTAPPPPLDMGSGLEDGIIGSGEWWAESMGVRICGKRVSSKFVTHALGGLVAVVVVLMVALAVSVSGDDGELRTDGPGLRIDCARTGLDISNWQDTAGDGCEQYAMNGWCCPESSPHCNEEYAVGGVDSDRACCASCSQSIGAFSVYANFSSGQHTFTMRRMRPSGAGRKFRWRCAN